MGDLSGLTALITTVTVALSFIIRWFFSLPIWLMVIVGGGGWLGFVLLRRHLRK